MRLAPLAIALALSLTACGSTGPSAPAGIPDGVWAVTGLQGTAGARDYGFRVITANADTAIIDWISGAMVRELPARDTLLRNGTGGLFRAQFNSTKTRVILFDFTRPYCSGRDLWIENDRLQTDDWESCALAKVE